VWDTTSNVEDLFNRQVVPEIEWREESGYISVDIDDIPSLWGKMEKKMKSQNLAGYVS
jgi:hypothetical protein